MRHCRRWDPLGSAGPITPCGQVRRDAAWVLANVAAGSLSQAAVKPWRKPWNIMEHHGTYLDKSGHILTRYILTYLDIDKTQGTNGNNLEAFSGVMSLSPILLIHCQQRTGYDRIKIKMQGCIVSVKVNQQLERSCVFTTRWSEEIMIASC